MKLGAGIVILVLAVGALVMEVEFFVTGAIFLLIGANNLTVGGFIWLMMMTGVAGATAPVCCLIEVISKKKNLGGRLFVGILGFAAVVCAVWIAISFLHGWPRHEQCC